MSVHLVLGAGGIGRAAALELCRRGHEVRLASRSGTDPRLSGVTPVLLDATDADGSSPEPRPARRPSSTPPTRAATPTGTATGRRSPGRSSPPPSAPAPAWSPSPTSTPTAGSTPR